MRQSINCQSCRAELDVAQQFAFLVEAQTVDAPVMLSAIRRLPHAAGRPLRVCRGCQAGIERARSAVVHGAHPRRPAPKGRQALLTAVAVVGLCAVTAKLGRWLA